MLPPSDASRATAQEYQRQASQVGAGLCLIGGVNGNGTDSRKRGDRATTAGDTEGVDHGVIPWF